MQAITESKVTENGYTLHEIQSNKFKTINVVVKFKAPLEKETITQRALLPYILQQGTNEHPSERSLRTALDDLYGAVLSIDSGKKGENHVISVRLEIANQDYLSGETEILDQAIKLMNEIILNPKSNQNSFDEKIVSREKQTLKQKIESVIDDKMTYANMRLIDEMCKDEPYRLHVHGYLEDLEKLDEKTLYDYYRQLLVEDSLDIYVLGDLQGKNVKQLIASYFSREQVTTNKPMEQNKKVISDVVEVIEEQNVQQGKLHLGYRTNVRYNDPDYYALQVFNGIFGGFPSSKLFMNVREKHSLAYYAASRFESHKGLLFVFSGIDPKDYKKAKDIIISQMDAMKAGEFTDIHVDETKNMIVNQLQETMDNSQGVIEVLYHQVLADSNITPEQLIEGIKQVGKEDVIAVAQKIELDTIYFLTSKGGGKTDE